ncbi:hypothetical protein PC129_g22015 [Phytophthora cactorum]|uniref:Uncharacterized protein n=1 Tax=Phytophthora cactorum TaxID=29920 RepID=A0A8T1H4H8_9STRA|nr:hypothetical protein PC112_g16410 [Phytophthora cactorum]KAG2865219.1 hypothetical protein PC113_g3898 [Phytophthora cactorum]KAG2887408.1 hypothetical protein PC115_g20357 [Phytophthora cactorum]KAG2914567.1 hypothetical protein PC117_g18274 [Phytophthora cactorum]KAG2960629.1 hypothetical protein PC118_g22407 [Phytophthora cactorum]
MACSEASVTGAEALAGTGGAGGGSAGASVAAEDAGGASEGADGAGAGFIGADVLVARLLAECRNGRCRPDEIRRRV